MIKERNRTIQLKREVLKVVFALAAISMVKKEDLRTANLTKYTRKLSLACTACTAECS